MKQKAKTKKELAALLKEALKDVADHKLTASQNLGLAKSKMTALHKSEASYGALTKEVAILKEKLLKKEKIFEGNRSLSLIAQNLSSELKMQHERYDILKKENERLKRTLRGMGNNVARLTDLIDDAPYDPPGTESAEKAPEDH